MGIKSKLKEAYTYIKSVIKKENNFYYQELKSVAQAITIEIDESDEPSTKEWKKFMLDVKKKILRGDLANFLHWKTIRYNMFIEEGEFLQKELNYQFIAYQDKFHEATNKPYFSSYVDNFEQLDCQIVPFDLMVGQSFLMIQPKNA